MTARSASKLPSMIDIFKLFWSFIGMHRVGKKEEKDNIYLELLCIIM